jgi:transcriptional regulator with XRE-family HTH domain
MNQREPTPERVFAGRLRELRTAQGLSQAALAEKMTALGHKINDLAILRIEKNLEDPLKARRVNLNEATAIASALGVGLLEMLRPEPPIADQVAAAEKELVALRQESTEISARTHEAYENLERLRIKQKSEMRLIALKDELSRANDQRMMASIRLSQASMAMEASMRAFNVAEHHETDELEELRKVADRDNVNYHAAERDFAAAVAQQNQLELMIEELETRM